jgi:FMN phosphatase YigB (HAD superfamily)
MAFRLVLFDLDDTLCDYAGARAVRLRTAFGQALATVGGAGVDLDRLIAESIAIHPHGVDHFPSLLARYGVACAETVTATQTWYRINRFYGLRLFPDALQTLGLARSGPLGRKVGLVTNGPADVQRAKIELFGLAPFVDFTLVSGEFGAAKPDAAIFAEAMRLGGAIADETLFVGDSPEFDIAGARACGMTTVWVNRTGWPWCDAGKPADYEVADLTALQALLRGLDARAT